MALSKWLVRDSLVQLISVATELGRYRESGDKVNFESRLVELGMNREEAGTYWDAIDEASSRIGSSADLSNDTSIATSCGISLSSEKFPRNFLLNRLAQCINPQALSVFLDVVKCSHRIDRFRWEYAGEGMKRVMVIRLPVNEPREPKKSKPRRRRTLSRYRMEGIYS